MMPQKTRLPRATNTWPGNRQHPIDAQGGHHRRGLRRAARHPLPTIAYGLFALLFSAHLPAQSEDKELQPLPEPPPLPPRVESGEVMEPNVTIVQGKQHTIHEYRVNGRLYAIKIVPKNAPPYYLIDTDGDGTLDHRGGLSGDLIVPQWVLFSW
uniref:DUF2782 domain-containing protein n=1 Tax=Candidatus Kentrum eta TaxID=2126337 RepID=A0A450V068_9GAMM|nr:MAG: Protein of unknown function (DUF2782) [Candidatus Kentron sp. H]VFJ98172.1 MAG: Protein of unknown function (DUF2782) [Candidatus Kentron sp. H]VFK03228.1 MAG: Protein of unknown function (DUF2782) [Candidatus Kentron sp. H]